MKAKDIFAQARTYAFDYADAALERNVFPTEAAIENLERFDEDLPDAGSDAAGIVRMLSDYGSPATVSQIGGRYFGFVNGGVVPAGLAARWLSDFWDQNSALGLMSPITSKLEEVCETLAQAASWVARPRGGGLCQRHLHGHLLRLWPPVAIALLQNAGWDVNKKRVERRPEDPQSSPASSVTPPCSRPSRCSAWVWTTSSSVEADEQGRIIPGAIPPLDNRTLLILQAGNVKSGSFEAFDEVCDMATSGWRLGAHRRRLRSVGRGSERLRHLTRGIAKANSWSVDGHKTLEHALRQRSSCCAMTKRHLVSALQATGSYILYTDKRDGMNYTPEMSRRARVIELWATLKYLGRTGVDALVYGLHERAVQMSQALSRAGFEILNDVVFNQVLVACETDAVTEATIAGVQASGECWAGGALWQDRQVIRISVCSWATTPDDITRSVKAFVRRACTAARQ